MKIQINRSRVVASHYDITTKVPKATDNSTAPTEEELQLPSGDGRGGEGSFYIVEIKKNVLNKTAHNNKIICINSSG